MLKNVTYLIVILLSMIFISCKTTHTSTTDIVTEVKHDTLYLKSYLHDSIYVESNTDLKIVNDTVYIRNTLTRYKYITKIDTVSKTVVDSIPFIVKKTDTVILTEKYVPWYVKTLAWIGFFAILCIVFYILDKLHII